MSGGSEGPAVARMSDSVQGHEWWNEVTGVMESESERWSDRGDEVSWWHYLVLLSERRWRFNGYPEGYMKLTPFHSRCGGSIHVVICVRTSVPHTSPVRRIHSDPGDGTMRKVEKWKSQKWKSQKSKVQKSKVRRGGCVNSVPNLKLQMCHKCSTHFLKMVTVVCARKCTLLRNTP